MPDLLGLDVSIPIAIGAGMIGVLIVWFLIKRTAKLLIMLTITAIIAFLWWYQSANGWVEQATTFFGK